MGTITNTYQYPIYVPLMNDYLFDVIAGNFVSVSITSSLGLAFISPFALLSVDANSSVVGTNLTDGQLLIGDTGAAAVAATLTAGSSNITITNGAGSITINTTLVPIFNNITLLDTSNQIIAGTGTTVTLNMTTPAANRVYTFPDVGASANVVMTAGAQTVAGAKTFSSAVTITPTSNQLVLGTTNTTTLSATAPAASRTYTMPDVLNNANFIMSEGTQTINGAKTFTSSINCSNQTITSCAGLSNTSGAITIDTVGFDININTGGGLGTLYLGGGVNVPTLTASHAVVTDTNKYLASLLYTASNTGQSIVFRDSSGNFSASTGTFSSLAATNTSNQLVLGTTNTTTLSATAPAASRTYTMPDVGGNADFVMTAGAQTVAGAKTFSSAVTITPTSNQIVLGVTNTGTINCEPCDGLIYTIPDCGVNTQFIMGQTNQTLAGAKTFSSAVTITPTSNQLVLGTTNTTTLSATAPAASRTYTMPDVGGNADFVMTAGAQTVAGAKTFSNGISTDSIANVSTDISVNTGANALKITGTTDASSTSTGSLQTSGGFGCAKKGYFGSGIFSNSVGLVSGTDFAISATTITTDSTQGFTTGTFTPTIGDGTNNFTLSTAVGWYYRVGKSVKFGAEAVWSSKGSASGNLRFSLPFTTSSTSSRRYPLKLGYISGVTCTTFLTTGANNNDAYTQIYKFVSGGAGTVLAAADCNSSGEIQWGGSFIV